MHYDVLLGKYMKLNQKCFVILPFSQTTQEHSEEYWTNHFNFFLKPIIQDKLKIIVERSEPMRTGVLQDIIKNLIFSSIVIADITDLNPNVMWEIGVRQSFTKGTIIIAEEDTKIPFDLSIKGLIFYPNDKTSANFIKKMTDFHVSLILAIQDCINYPEKPDSHILETISGRGTIFEIVYQKETMRKLEAFNLEIVFNKKILRSVMKTIEENKKNKKKTTLASRLKTDACNLLSNTRYLEENSSFFEIINEYSANMENVNAALSEWKFSSQATEDFLNKCIPEYLADIETVEKIFSSAQAKVEKII